MPERDAIASAGRSRHDELARLRDWFRDPRGWLMDALPWRIRRYLVAWRMDEKVSSLPDELQLIGWRRPSRQIIRALRRLEGVE